jgi:hypothetical protein
LGRAGVDNQQSLITPAKLQRNVVVKPITVTEIASFEPAGFLEEFRGMIRPSLQEIERWAGMATALQTIE